MHQEQLQSSVEMS